MSERRLTQLTKTVRRMAVKLEAEKRLARQQFNEEVDAEIEQSSSLYIVLPGHPEHAFWLAKATPSTNTVSGNTVVVLRCLEEPKPLPEPEPNQLPPLEVQ